MLSLSSDIIRKEFPIDLAPSPAVAALVVHNWGLGILILHANEIDISWKNLLEEYLEKNPSKYSLKRTSEQIFVEITGALWFEKDFIKFLTPWRLSWSITTRKYGSDNWILMKRLPFSPVPRIFHDKRKKGRGDAGDQTTCERCL